ncbi:MAG TPA: pitrilysin family protein [Gemmatimonadaceae bacterium]|nr:pitrilysin family protein [Gemmatimonadaceae bacterium]
MNSSIGLRRATVAAVPLATAIALAALATPSAAQRASFDRSKPPVLGPAPQLVLPGATERTLPNGLRLIIVEQHELPLVDISLVVKSGGEFDPAGKTGAATLASTLMSEGAGSRNSQAIAEQQAFLGVFVSAFAGWDQSGVSLHAPTAVLDSALALFADVALRPTFPAEEFDRQKRQRMTQLLQVNDRGPAMADRAFAAILYGDSHPYGRPLAGTESTVESLTRDDIVAFYRSVYRPNNAFMLIVGDVTPADIERRITSLFGSWERGAVPAPPSGTAPARTDRRIYFVDKPAAAQSSFRIGTVGVARTTDDFYPLQVMNTILGGAFTSRLNMKLREEKGYSYGATSGFSMRRDPGPFTARSEIQANKTDSALIEFVKELDGMSKPLTPAELDKAKKYLQLGLPGAYETTGSIAGQLSTYALYGLPLNEPTRAVARLGAVTAADVQRVATKYVDPSKLAIVIAGDARTLVPLLKATGIAPVELRDSYGRVIISQ